jgi:hypothetical protein
MRLDNFLPVNRELQKHWIYKDSSYLHCWLEMLFNARFSTESKTEIYKGVVYTINRGEFIYSRPTYSQRLNMTEGKLRSFMNILLKEGMIIEVRSLGKNKPTIFKICNYDLYNSQPSESVGNSKVDTNNDQVTTKSQPSDNQVTTTKEYRKERKKENNVISTRFTPPTLAEVSSYCLERNNSIDPQHFIDYNESKGWVVGKVKMKDWKAAIRTWEKSNYKQNSKPILDPIADAIKRKEEREWLNR